MIVPVSLPLPSSGPGNRRDETLNQHQGREARAHRSSGLGEGPDLSPGEQMLGAAPVSAGGQPCFPVGQSRPTARSPNQRLLRPPPLLGCFGFSPGEAGFPGPRLSQAPTTGSPGNTPSTVFVYCSLGLAVAYLSISLPILPRPRWLSLLVHSLALRSSVSALSFSPFLLCFPRVCHSPCVSVFCSCLISFFSLLLSALLSFCPTFRPLNRPSITRLDCSFFCDFQPALEGWDTSPTDEGVTYAALPIGH